MGLLRFALLFLLLFVVIQTSCGNEQPKERYRIERPDEKPWTKWSSSDPYMWFEVASDFNAFLGELELDGELIDIIVSFYPRTGMSVDTSRDAYTTIFYGYCEFKKDEFTLTVSKEEYIGQHPLYRLDDSIETITFYREE